MPDFDKTSPMRDFFLCGMGDLLLLVGPQAPSAESVVWLDREAGRFADEHRGRGLYLHFVRDEPGFAMPDEAARTAMHRFVTRAGAKFAAAAVVVDQQGFLGSTIRSVFSGVLLAVRTPTPTKICANVIEARTFLQGRLATAELPEPERLLAELARMKGAAMASATL